MSLLIKGMEMPKQGRVTLQIGADGAVYVVDRCEITAEKYEKNFEVFELSLHGRLIDADALMLIIQEYIDEYGWDVDEHGFHSEKWCAMKETEMAINDAPTVIPADKDGEENG